jgi:hypothetical protein
MGGKARRPPACRSSAEGGAPCPALACMEVSPVASMLAMEMASLLTARGTMALLRRRGGCGGGAREGRGWGYGPRQREP